MLIRLYELRLTIMKQPYSNQSPIAQTRPQSGWCRHLAAKQPCHEVHVTTWLGWPSGIDAPLSPLIPVSISILELWAEEQIYLPTYIVLIMYHHFINFKIVDKKSSMVIPIEFPLSTSLTICNFLLTEERQLKAHSVAVPCKCYCIGWA